MVKYQGNKSKYAGKIVGHIRNICGQGIRLADFCCGSGEISSYWAKPTVMIDKGPWGTFWQAIKMFRPTAKDGDIFYDDEAYESFCRRSLARKAPSDPVEFAITFLALQREAFQGKPVGCFGGLWKFPGFDGKFSRMAFLTAWRRACELRPLQVIVGDVNHAMVEADAIYVDPDYEGTTGYNGLRVKLGNILHNYPRAHIFVSHHRKFDKDYEWDDVFDVTVANSGRLDRGSSLDDTELLFYRKPKE